MVIRSGIVRVVCFQRFSVSSYDYSTCKMALAAHARTWSFKRSASLCLSRWICYLYPLLLPLHLLYLFGGWFHPYKDNLARLRIHTTNNLGLPGLQSTVLYSSPALPNYRALRLLSFSFRPEHTSPHLSGVVHHLAIPWNLAYLPVQLQLQLACPTMVSETSRMRGCLCPLCPPILYSVRVLRRASHELPRVTFSFSPFAGVSPAARAPVILSWI